MNFIYEFQMSFFCAFYKDIDIVFECVFRDQVFVVVGNYKIDDMKGNNIKEDYGELTLIYLNKS